ncbi:MAG: hypothetical protein ACFFD2_11295 [Promethearchaeota archaeon]
MTSTTIQVDKKTKEELFLLKNQIEKKLGKAINYNDLLRIFLENNKNAILKKNLKDFRKFKGILPQNTIKIFKNERKIDVRTKEHE